MKETDKKGHKKPLKQSHTHGNYEKSSVIMKQIF